MANDSLDRLYNAIGSDLKISQFKNEPIISYHNRLVYSALGRWILELFLDRDLDEENLVENENDNRVSKMHVTICAEDFLKSILECDSSLEEYFDKNYIIKNINEIEKIYINLGYVISKKYTFKNNFNKGRINFDEVSLIVNNQSNINRMIGLGIWDKKKLNDSNIEDFNLIKLNALDYFNEIKKRLNYEKYDDKYDFFELFDIENKRWKPFNFINIKHEYEIIRYDKPIQYKLIKVTDNGVYIANFPDCYNDNSDDYIKNEIWRIISGLCSYLNKPFICNLYKIYSNAFEFSTFGYVFPLNELSLISCMSWPLKKSGLYSDFVASEAMTIRIINILEKLSIKVVEIDK